MVFRSISGETSLLIVYAQNFIRLAQLEGSKVAIVYLKVFFGSEIRSTKSDEDTQTRQALRVDSCYFVDRMQVVNETRRYELWVTVRTAGGIQLT